MATTSKFMPHIRFNDGKCREAFEFYKNIFGGELSIMTIGEAPKDMFPKDMPMPPADNVIHASLSGNGFMLLGADMMRDPVKVGDQISIMVNCASQQEVDSLFKKMSDGGDIFMKPMKMFWGGYYGSVTDKYGVEWSFNFQMDPSQK